VELLSLVGEDETAGYYAQRRSFGEKDVWVTWFQRPTPANIDKFLMILAASKKRMIVKFSCNEVNLRKWQRLIEKTQLPIWESLDEKVVIIYKDGDPAPVPEAQS
jgi:hypothetical protein